MAGLEGSMGQIHWRTPLDGGKIAARTRESLNSRRLEFSGPC